MQKKNHYCAYQYGQPQAGRGVGSTDPGPENRRVQLSLTQRCLAALDAVNYRLFTPIEDQRARAQKKQPDGYLLYFSKAYVLANTSFASDPCEAYRHTFCVQAQGNFLTPAFVEPFDYISRDHLKRVLDVRTAIRRGEEAWKVRGWGEPDIRFYQGRFVQICVLPTGEVTKAGQALLNEQKKLPVQAAVYGEPDAVRVMYFTQRSGWPWQKSSCQCTP